MRGFLVAAILVAGCAQSTERPPRSHLPEASAASTASATAEAVPAAASPASDVAATPAPSDTGTASPAELKPRQVRRIGGVDFALVAGRADLRVETTVRATADAAIRDTVERDMVAVEREFGRTFAARPVIYVFNETEGYTSGLSRILGYADATARFIAENSVSFFEPALGIVLVNWGAVADRAPVTAIRHELTHLLTLDACGANCDLVPAWLNEGEARLLEALTPGGDWRLVRVRDEAASMAATGTLLPLSGLVSQLDWNALGDWAGYYKYQQAARVTELLREDVGGDAPIARLYARIRAGQNVAQAYAALTGRSFDAFVAELPPRIRGDLHAPSFVTLRATTNGIGASYLLYGFPPGATVMVTTSGPRGSENWPVAISPFGALFDGIAPNAPRGMYTISVQHEGGVMTFTLEKPDPGSRSDAR